MSDYVIIVVFCVLVAWIILLHRRNRAPVQAPRISERRKSDFIASVLDSSRDGILIQDMNAKILWASPSWCKMMGYNLEEVIGLNPLSFVIPEDNMRPQQEIENFEYDLQSGFLDEVELVQNLTKDGGLIWTALSFSHHETEDGESRVIVNCRDVTEQTEKEQELEKKRKEIEFRADHDVLTSVANRQKLTNSFDDVLAEADESGQNFGLLHIDLDYFKEVNDTFGHAAGDSVIVTASRRMEKLLGPLDLLARIGGDEFVILSPDHSNFADLTAFGDKIVSTLADPIIWEDKKLQIGASVGIALSSASVRDLSAMMHNADIALYEAKKQGRGRCICYDDALDRSYLDITRMTAELAEAIEKDQFEVYLQPQYSLIAKVVTGFEAVTRWNHPTKGLLSPRSFMSMVNKSGVAEGMDKAAARQAIKALKDFANLGYEGLQISINASPQTIAKGDFSDFLKWEADRNNVSLDQISVEVNETSFLSAQEGTTKQTIKNISAAGFRVELDGFGTGYAGLSHLGRLRLDGVKIDPTMIEDLASNVTNQIIVQAMVELCSDLGLKVTAEGVINADQARILREFGCVNIQGSGIAKAMSFDDTVTWMREVEMNKILNTSPELSKTVVHL